MLLTIIIMRSIIVNKVIPFSLIFSFTLQKFKKIVEIISRVIVIDIV